MAERPRREGDAVHTRSVWLSSERLGLTGKIDVLEEADGQIAPVEYKKGRPPDRERCPDGYWPNDAIQLCAQGLLIEDQGGGNGQPPARVDRGFLYFAAVRQRVEVPMTESLRQATREATAAALALVGQDDEPPPLVDSPKCPACSLVALCMPDETIRLRTGAAGIVGDPQRFPPPDDPVRCLIPADYHTEILYVAQQGASVGKTGDQFIVRDREGAKLAEVPGAKLRQICLYGYGQLTTQAVHACMDLGIDVAFFSTGGRLKGHLAGLPNANGLLRSTVARSLQSEAVRLAIAREVIASKIHNQRVMLMRNTRAEARGPDFAGDVEQLGVLVRSAGNAVSRESLLGIEGSAARIYFARFSGMIRAEARSGEGAFAFEHRNRRPPRDPVNALLSLGYACLVKDVLSAVAAVGLDPYVGALHESRRGQPALALDLMEEFRPLVADSVALSLINNRVLGPSDFVRGRQSCNLTDAGRRAYFGAYEDRKADECTHPVFSYKTSYVRLLEMQARVLARFLTGQIPAYAGFRTR